ncbi:hypothetical protein ZWY2020_023864 [Hordeum vulgare]|nr:hypothetical protein ZWY2020_023864 [Hordeum vulgare]
MAASRGSSMGRTIALRDPPPTLVNSMQKVDAVACRHTANGGIFVSCNECAIPVCRPFYEYECKEGNQYMCQTRYKRLKEL